MTTYYARRVDGTFDGTNKDGSFNYGSFYKNFSEKPFYKLVKSKKEHWRGIPAAFERSFYIQGDFVHRKHHLLVEKDFKSASVFDGSRACPQTVYFEILTELEVEDLT